MGLASRKVEGARCEKEMVNNFGIVPSLPLYSALLLPSQLGRRIDAIDSEMLHVRGRQLGY